MMEIMISHAKMKPFVFTSANKYSNTIHSSCENLDNDTMMVPPIKIQLPLHRPRYKPPKPIKFKPPPPLRRTKPITTTTSDVLYFMGSLNLPITLDMYSSLIKECTNSGDASEAIELHEHMRKSRVAMDLLLLNRILLMHVTCGCLERAYQLFVVMPVRDFKSWAVMIAGFVENGLHSEALDLFVRMLYHVKFENFGDDNDRVRFLVSGILLCALKACLGLVDLNLGMQVHGWLWKMGFSENVTLISFLISFYGKMKRPEIAERVFDQVHSRNTAVWTSRIVNYCQDDDIESAIAAFKEMGICEIKKNSYTFSSVLKACGKLCDVECGRQVHANVMKLGLESNGFVQCALVDLYGKYGLIADASRMFEYGKNETKDACFNAMVENYMRNGLSGEAIENTLLNEDFQD